MIYSNRQACWNLIRIIDWVLLLCMLEAVNVVKENNDCKLLLLPSYFNTFFCMDFHRRWIFPQLIQRNFFHFSSDLTKWEQWSTSEGANVMRLPEINTGFFPCIFRALLMGSEWRWMWDFFKYCDDLGLWKFLIRIHFLKSLFHFIFFQDYKNLSKGFKFCRQNSRLKDWIFYT